MVVVGTVMIEILINTSSMTDAHDGPRITTCQCSFKFHVS